jgi:hypothetical protein
MSHLYFGARIKIDFLPLDASDEYLRGMMSMVSKSFSAFTVLFEQCEGMTGFVTVPTISEAVHLIDTLNGISNGAMVDQVLKVDWATSSRTKKPIEPGSPVAKKTKNCAWSSLSGTEPPLPPPLAGRTPDAADVNEVNGLLLSHDTVEIDNLPIDATDGYLRGMLVMMSSAVTSLRVVQEDGDTRTGYSTFASPQEADYIIEQMNGFPEGASNGKLLKVFYPWPRVELRQSDRDSTLPLPPPAIHSPA